jgi:hypothetical protein
MSNYPRKIDRAAAERLLRGEPADPRQQDDLLAVLLATAVAPARASELAGEEAAVAAFRQARAAARGGVASLGLADRSHSAVGEVSTLTDLPGKTGPEKTGPKKREPGRGWIRHPVWLALAALTATTAGGVALAASSGPWSRQPADQRPATATPTPAPPAAPGSGQGQSGTAGATPHPSLVGLCRAYSAGAGSASGKALDNPAFTSLLRAAGGKDKVPAFCADVLAAEARKAGKAKKSAPSGHAKSPDQSGATDQSGQSGQTNGTERRSTVLPTPSVRPDDRATPQHTRSQGTHLLSA